MRRLVLPAALASLALAAPAGAGAASPAVADPPAAAPSAHPKRCGLIARGSSDYRVRARVVTCRFAMRWSRAYLRNGSKPSGYSCSRPGGSFALYCRKGNRTYWAERIGASAHAAHPGHGPGQVIIAVGRYSPRTLKVATGDAVLWFWNGPDVDHTVTADPGQAESFDSDPLGVPVHQRNDVYSHTFTKVGRFTYFCRVHPETMRGTIEVVPPPALDVKPPRLTRVRASGATWFLRFRSSERAALVIRLERRTGAAWRRIRTFNANAKRGANRLTMPLKNLPAGDYRARLVAYDAADNASRRAFARFRV